MSHVNKARLAQLLEVVEKADLAVRTAQAANAEAQKALYRAQGERNDAHDAAIKAMRNELGLVIHEGQAWSVENNRMVSKPIALDLSPRQESLLDSAPVTH